MPARPPTTPDSAPAWSEAELTNPHAVADKARRVRAMFAAIAPKYDLNNRVHSLGRDQAWRRAAVKMAEVRAGDRVLDVACGTGDLTLAFLSRLAKIAGLAPGQAIGVDFTYEMLPIARSKARRRRGSVPGLAPGPGPGPGPGGDAPAAAVFINGDAHALPLAQASVDVVSIAFGIRNVADPTRAMAEFFRVLRPGGRVIVLEFSLPQRPVLRRLYNFYFRHVMPRTAAWIARDRSGAYRYLPESVNTFIGREAMAELMAAAGFERVTLRALTLGIAVIYRGVKPAEKGKPDRQASDGRRSLNEPRP